MIHEVNDHTWFRPLAAEYTDNPLPTFRHAHAYAPVFRDEAAASCFVFSDRACREVLADGVRFSKDRTLWRDYQGEHLQTRYPVFADLRKRNPLHNPARHRAVRAVIGASFRPANVKRIDALVEQVVSASCGPLRADPTQDLCPIFREIPGQVFARVIGIEGDSSTDMRFREAASAFLLGCNPLATEADLERAEAGARVIDQVLRELIEARRRQLGSDYISAVMIAADECATDLDEGDIVSVLAALLAAGYDTTSSGAALQWRTLFSHPELLEGLRSGACAIDAAVMELLRYDFPGKFVIRFVSEDTCLDGVALRRGDMVCVSLHGAGFDPARFQSPYRVDPQRSERSLVFGHGEHYCLGVHLARQELTATLRFAVEHLDPELRVDATSTRWVADNFQFRIPRHMRLK